MSSVLFDTVRKPCVGKFVVAGFLDSNWRIIIKKKRFNGAHKWTRSVIEKSFRILKQRLHVIHGEIRLAPYSLRYLIE